jgi:hypothetical protein
MRPYIHVSEPPCGAVRQVLLHDWDPIGVGDHPCAQDEYDSYIAGIIRLVAGGADSFRLADHLYQLETVCMGLPGGRGRRVDVARKLLSLLGSDYLER